MDPPQTCRCSNSISARDPHQVCQNSFGLEQARQAPTTQALALPVQFSPGKVYTDGWRIKPTCLVAIPPCQGGAVTAA